MKMNTKSRTLPVVTGQLVMGPAFKPRCSKAQGTTTTVDGCSVFKFSELGFPHLNIESVILFFFRCITRFPVNVGSSEKFPLQWRKGRLKCVFGLFFLYYWLQMNSVFSLQDVPPSTSRRLPAATVSCVPVWATQDGPSRRDGLAL